MSVPMYKTNCPYCGAVQFAYAIDKLGTLPVIYCTKCKGNAKAEKRMYDRKRN